MESTREEVKLGSRQARQRHCCGTSLLKCSEVVSWLTEDDDLPGRQVERGERLRHALHDGGGCRCLIRRLASALGLAFVLRNVIQLVAGTEVRTLSANVTSSVSLGGGLHIGRTELWVVIVAFAALVALALMLGHTRLGTHIRALSDNAELAETTGLDTGRIIVYTWILAGGLAGLAGVVYGASIGVITPNLGFGIVLSIFAAAIIGGIGDAYGALAGGIFIGLVQEWSTLVFPVNLKVAVGFGAMIAVLVLRPQGIFGRARNPGR